MQQIEINRRRVMSGAKAIPLTFIAKQQSNITFTIPSSVTPEQVEYVEYSIDNCKTWIKTNNTNEQVVITIPTLQQEDSVMLRGKATSYGNASYGSKFSINGNVEAIGNVNSLLNEKFAGIKKISDYCFAHLFQGCTGLYVAPELPALELGVSAYDNMFQECTNLRKAPYLPALKVPFGGYSYMFFGCSSLVYPPEMEVLELERYSCNSMFSRCSSLIESPILKAPILAQECYQNLFTRCTAIRKITMLATDISASNCLAWWVEDVGSTGTFIKNPAMTTLPTGTSGIPEGWTVEDYVG